jgi:hypothetical protein
MNTKTIVLLAAILLILGILYYGIDDPRGTRKQPEPEAFVPDFDPSAATGISISLPDAAPLKLTRTGGAWFVTVDNQTWQADADPVDALLANVAGLKIDTVASRNRRNFDLFEVTEDTGVQTMITGADGNILAHFFVGKSGPDIFSTYIRSAAADSVVLTGGILKTIYDRPLNEWRDKTIFDLAAEAVVEYRIEGDLELHLRKDTEAVWHLVSPESFTPAPGTVESAVQTFAGLEAADFATGDETISEPVRKLTARLTDGTSRVLLVDGAKNTFQTFVRPAGDAQNYVLENHVLEALCPTLDALRPAEEQPPAGETLPAADNDTAGEPPFR